MDDARQRASPVIAGGQGAPLLPSAIPPETEPIPKTCASLPHHNTQDAASASTPPAQSPQRPSLDAAAPARSAALEPRPQSSGPARPHAPSAPHPPPDRQLPARASSDRFPKRRRPSLFGSERAATATREMPVHLAEPQPFFYDFDEYSPSSSDTPSSSDEDARQPAAPPARKRLKRRGTDKSLDQSPEEGKENDKNYKRYSRFSVGNQYFRTKGKVSKLDGRLKISVNETANSGFIAKALGSGIRHHLGLAKVRAVEPGAAESPAQERRHQQATAAQEAVKLQKLDQERLIVDEREAQAAGVPKQIPKLNIVIIVIGSRGDIQPFLKIGKILKNEHGHRVRIATHPAFKDFVEKDSDLEFFSVGGDPSELMAFMVKNPGLIPSIESVKAGEIGKRRAAMYEMFQGMWRACINTTDDESDKENIKMSMWPVQAPSEETVGLGEKHPFVADAIIANPPSFAHVHIAERLGIPLHMMFTFPYSPTTQFPHPLANIKKSNVDISYTNFMSYPLVEMMTWQGLGDLVNKFRVKTLGLEPVSTLWAPGQLYRMKVPYTYMWSPSLVPKPEDWGPEIDIAGYVFLELASSFTPPDDLARFLEAGPPPVYIGFGSIVVDDPEAFTQMIFKAVELAGVRALVSKGWGGIGGEEGTPKNVFLLENTPHDWLFPRVSAVVHHGGAGTTAIGLKCGKPTMIVPFFGDQPFWGSMVSKAKAGAHDCVPHKKLTAESLAEGIKQCLSDEAKHNVAKIARSMEKEGDGAENAVRSFHRSLPLAGENSMRCSFINERAAAWQLKGKRGRGVKLSPFAAEVLAEQKRLKWSDLRIATHYEWNDFEGPGEPISGVGGAVTGTVVEAATGVGSVPKNMVKSVKKRGRHEKKKRKLAKKQRQSLEQNGAVPASEDDDAGDTTLEMGGVEEETDAEGEQRPQRPSQDQRNGAQNRGQQRDGTTPQGPARINTDLSVLSADPDQTLPEELSRSAGKGITQTSSAIARAPVDLALAIAQGFHNAPRLYGDDTVRAPVRINGWHSGLRASKQEFVYGIYDGWTGLWKQPIRGAKENGAVGFVRGMGLGAGGLVLKNVSALVGPLGYTAKGLHREVRNRRRGSKPMGVVRKARILQGSKESDALDRQHGLRELEEKVLRGWDEKMEALESKKGKKDKEKSSARTSGEGGEKEVEETKAEEQTPGGEAAAATEATRNEQQEKNQEKEDRRSTAAEKPVPRRRSTLKKKPPKRTVSGRQRRSTAPAESLSEEQQPLQHRSPSQRAKMTPRAEYEPPPPPPRSRDRDRRWEHHHPEEDGPEDPWQDCEEGEQSFEDYYAQLHRRDEDRLVFADARERLVPADEDDKGERGREHQQERRNEPEHEEPDNRKDSKARDTEAEAGEKEMHDPRAEAMRFRSGSDTVDFAERRVGRVMS